jgi:hypothetical protein
MNPMLMLPLWHPLVESNHTNSVQLTDCDGGRMGQELRVKFAASGV